MKGLWPLVAGLTLALLFVAICTREETTVESQRIASLEASVAKLKGRVSKANYALNFFMAGEWDWERCVDRIPETRLADGSWLITLNVIDCDDD